MSPSFSKIAMTAGLAASALFVFSGNAQAFTFKTNTSINNAPKGDIWLDSIELSSGRIIDHVLVQDVTDLTNTTETFNKKGVGNNDGGASTDKGDQATSPDGIDPNENPAESEIKTYLANENLNNIIDTEDKTGQFSMILDFGQVIKSLMVWERGANSKLGLEALDADGNPISSGIINSADSKWKYAGFDIDTTEISGKQPVMSLGIDIAKFFDTDAEISKIRVFSENAFSGPDWKIMGSTADVPEPATVLGLVALGGAFVASRRRQADA